MRKPGLFLDRDGVVNVDKGYVHRREDFFLVDGIFELVSTGASLGYTPVIVTNQSGIARGLFTEASFRDLTDWMLELFKSQGAPIAAVYHCPYLPDAPIAEFSHPNHPWRKPAPGMLFAARDDLNLDLERSVLVGDNWSDVLAGKAAGLRRIALIGRHPPTAEDTEAGLVRVDSLATVREAADWLRRHTLG